MKPKQKIDFQSQLSHEYEVRVRFGEVDSMAIAWHGSYVKYLEDGRESFGAEHGLGYMDIFGNGYMAPLVKLDINYKKTLEYGDTAIVKTIFKDSPAAKIIFQYEIRRKRDNEIVATAETIQIFMNTKRELELNPPQFFIEWKKNKLKSK